MKHPETRNSLLSAHQSQTKNLWLNKVKLGQKKLSIRPPSWQKWNI